MSYPGVIHIFVAFVRIARAPVVDDSAYDGRQRSEQDERDSDAGYSEHGVASLA
jgi:hypothetical protein